MKVLVTGSSGFIGSNLVPLLRSMGHDVVGLDVVPPTWQSGLDHFELVDVRDEDGVRGAVRRAEPQVVIHLAARTDIVSSPDLSDYSTNVLGVQSLLAACRSHKVSRALLASSRLVFAPDQKPLSGFDYSADTDYGRSKVQGELLVRQSMESDHPSELVIVRPTSIWGPRFSLPYAQFFQSVVSGRYVHPKGVRVLKSFGYVGNVCRQLELLTRCDLELDGQPIWLTDIEPIEIMSFANEIRTAVGKGDVREIPKDVLDVLAAVGDFLRPLGLESKYPLTSSRLKNLTVDTVYDTSLERRIFAGLQQTTLSEGVAETVLWLSGSGERH